MLPANSQITGGKQSNHQQVMGKRNVPPPQKRVSWKWNETHLWAGYYDSIWWRLPSQHTGHLTSSDITDRIHKKTQPPKYGRVVKTGDRENLPFRRFRNLIRPTENFELLTNG
jgi:hypothetical protein